MLDRVETKVYEQVMHLEKEEPDIILQERYTPGFMNGAAGIGYYLLKQIDGGLPEILEL